MITQNMPTKFTALQQQMLKLFGRGVPEEDLIAIKDMIGKYFLDKLQQKADAGAKEKGYTQQDFDSWLNEPEQ